MNAARCSLSASAVNNLKYTCEGATISCNIALSATTGNHINFISAASPSFSCTLPVGYTGQVYSGIPGYTPPPNCNNINTNSGSGPGVSLTAFSYFNAALQTRDITTIFTYKVGIPLTAGKPSVINTFTQRKIDAHATLGNKPLARMTKTTFYIPSKLSNYPLSAYQYQFLAADGYHPPF